MDKNTITGFILIALVLIGFSWYTKPTDEQIAEQNRKDSIALVKANELKKAQEAKKTAEAAKPAAVCQDSAAASMKEERVVLKNEKLELTLSTKGGTVQKAVVKGFKDKDDKGDVVLFDAADQHLSYTLATKTANINTADLMFAVKDKSDKAVRLEAGIAGGGKVVFSYALGDSYLLQFSLKAEGMNGQFAPEYNRLSIDWRDHIRQQEKGFTFENRYSALTYHY
ncbi:MAG: YidC/Oxa1 family insertase periplasmic-domain containing protein, partial [Bacteroidaceae bacterium]|nr:YidC/Oxa1 family insertase periplasmic-domain containing protein [Bacteroidaceae bacterium]